MKGFYKAIRLEFNSMLERKFSLAFFIIMPLINIFLFAKLAQTPITWGQFKALSITSYDLFAPGILALLIMFYTVQFTILRIVGERAPYGTLDRDLLAISKSGMYFGKFFASFIITLIQIALIFISIIYFFPVKMYGDPSIVLIFLVFSALFGLSLGYAISIFSKSKEQAIQLVPFLFLLLISMSGLLTRLDMMVPIMRAIAVYFPLTAVYQALENVMLNGVGFEDVAMNLWKLIACTFGLMLVSLVKFKFERKK